jgi:peptidoglycan hydrolase-like protein with peptidoglycan-binding domain
MAPRSPMSVGRPSSPAMMGALRQASAAQTSVKRTAGTQSKNPGYWRQRKRWWRYGAQGAYSQWAAGMQACLAQAVGTWVPQNGILGPQTRRAVQIFQGQQQMPVTGMLDAATVAALQSACTGAAPGPQAPPPGAGLPPGPPGPPPDAGPPAPAGPPAAGAPEATGEAEIGAPELEGETEHEFRVIGQCKVQIESHDAVPFSQDEHFHWAPDLPAVYVIYIDGKAWHVGTAEHNLRCDLLESARVLKRLNIGLSAMKNRSVGWVSIRSGAATSCAIQRRRGASFAFHPVHAKHGILRILKRLLSKKLEISHKGSTTSGTIVFGPGGSLTIVEKGKQSTTLSPGTRL